MIIDSSSYLVVSRFISSKSSIYLCQLNKLIKFMTQMDRKEYFIQKEKSLELRIFDEKFLNLGKSNFMNIRE